jgi:prephenate dehydrogenase
MDSPRANTASSATNVVAEADRAAESGFPGKNNIHSVAILGTGLIGASIGLALKAAGFRGRIVGWDPDPAALKTALDVGAVALPLNPYNPFFVTAFDLVILAGPVFAIAESLELIAPSLSPHQLVTDVGSVKQFLCQRAESSYNALGKPSFLPGHPMAGREVAGAANADARLFEGAVWLFTPVAGPEHPLASDWRRWVTRMGARTLDLPPDRHDLLCAWVSHLPQLLATALASLLEEHFANDPPLQADLHQIGNRALREMTRLGQSPYSMWRDIAHTNEPAIAAALLAMEQQLTYLRENLKTPELKTAFAEANAFRATLPEPR